MRKPVPTSALAPVLPPFARSLCFLACLAGSFAATPAVAQVQNAAPSGIDRVLITATRTEQPLDQTLAQAQVLTRDEIERAGPITLAELLQRHAGLEIRATGGPGQPSSVFLRGGNATHTLVLVDGLRVGSSSSGATAFEHIPLSLIERVEIVKGPLSGLYGSDAIGGVVQIFTRQSGKPRFTAATGFGSDSRVALGAGFSTRDRGTALTIDVGYDSVRAASATNARAGQFTYNSDRDPYRNSHALVKLAQELWQGETLALTAWQSRGKTDFDAGPGTAINTQTLSGYHLSSENVFGPQWTSRLIVGRSSDDSVIASGFPGTFKTTQDQVSWFNEFKTTTGFMSAGAEWRGEKLASSTAYSVKKRDTTSVFAGYLERLGPGQFEFTARRDEEDQFGPRNTGSLSYGYSVLPWLTAYARAGRAFRAPGFNDLYYPGFSNPALRPERSDQAEAGLRVNTEQARLALVHFENRIEDLIVFDSASAKPQNLRRARIKGWELTAETSFAGMAIKSALTVQRPEDQDSSKQLRSRARQFGNLTASKSFGAWEVGGSVFASSARFDSSSEAPATRMGGYAVLGATVRYRIDKTWSVDVSVQNLADRRYELAQGYETPRRSLFVNVRAIAF